MKVSQAAAHYQAAGATVMHPAAAANPAFNAAFVSQKCRNCVFFNPPNDCTQINAPVSAEGWCTLWRDI